jgi:tripartite-type tricarboxylate transporter receptor subunit TctC
VVDDLRPRPGCGAAREIEPQAPWRAPSVAEIGVRNYELRIWTGVLAPVGTPKDVILKVNAAVQDILRTPEIRQEIENEGGQAGATTPEAFQTFLSADRVHWRELVDESGVPKVM